MKQEIYQMVDYIDLTPTWRGLMPVLLQRFHELKQEESDNGLSDDQRTDLDNLTSELYRLAEFADGHNGNRA